MSPASVQGQRVTRHPRIDDNAECRCHGHSLTVLRSRSPIHLSVSAAGVERRSLINSDRFITTRTINRPWTSTRRETALATATRNTRIFTSSSVIGGKPPATDPIKLPIRNSRVSPNYHKIFI